jgi:hypothetical protein
MDDKNFNQGHQSRQDWDRDRNRSEQDKDWSSQGNTSRNQNRNQQQEYRDVGYSGDSAHGMGTETQGNKVRLN